MLLLPEQRIYDPSVVVDPETGEALDPNQQPASAAQASALVKGTVAFRAINRAGIGGESGDTAAGTLDETKYLVILPSAAASAASGAVDMIVRGERHQITAQKFDGVGAVQRLLLYGQER